MTCTPSCIILLVWLPVVVAVVVVGGGGGGVVCRVSFRFLVCCYTAQLALYPCVHCCVPSTDFSHLSTNAA